uniref:glucose-6-phosphate 1-epimerase n=1 Tax=Biomphalaria glabrata TaxID=6526 RepID=A0A2C9KR95_BIOGL
MDNQDPQYHPAGDIIVLDRGEGTTAVIHLHGATVLSWKCHGVENLYMSQSAVFDNKKAIRGGIPVVFPNFGPWPLGPQHGFARIKRWSIAVPPRKDANGDVIVLFMLEADEETLAMWNYKFRLVYTVVLTATSLMSTLVVHNKDVKSLGFTCLLHTYLRVADIKHLRIEGLQGLIYVDKLKNGKEKKESREFVTVCKNYDRVYKDAPKRLNIVSGPEPVRNIELVTFNFPDIVVWNPWEEKAKEMSDFDDDGYTEMICVEPGKVLVPITLEAGQQYECKQTLICKF